MKKLSVQVVRYKCCEQQHHRNAILQKWKAPVITNEGFTFLVARGGIEPGWGCLILSSPLVTIGGSRQPNYLYLQCRNIRRIFMEVVIKKWGNSPALRLSASLMKEAQLALDQKVTVKVLRGKIIIEPTTRKEYKLEELVAGITPDNVHEESDFGKPVGKEIW
jgi:antitoxin MazE